MATYGTMQLQWGSWPLRRCKTPVGVVGRHAIRASVVLPSPPQFAPTRPFPAFVVGLFSVTVTARENKSKERKLYILMEFRVEFMSLVVPMILQARGSWETRRSEVGIMRQLIQVQNTLVK